MSFFRVFSNTSPCKVWDAGREEERVGLRKYHLREVDQLLSLSFLLDCILTAECTNGVYGMPKSWNQTSNLEEIYVIFAKFNRIVNTILTHQAFFDTKNGVFEISLKYSSGHLIPLKNEVMVENEYYKYRYQIIDLLSIKL